MNNAGRQACREIDEILHGKAVVFELRHEHNCLVIRPTLKRLSEPRVQDLAHAKKMLGN